MPPSRLQYLVAAIEQGTFWIFRQHFFVGFVLFRLPSLSPSGKSRVGLFRLPPIFPAVNHTMSVVYISVLQ